MDKYVKGTCTAMCPESEIELRSRERLLHYFEIDWSKRRGPLPDRTRIVKAFARSAAGSKAQQPADLRTPDALMASLKFLLLHVVVDKRKPFYYIYDFIFDRLRSIRQEIVIQNLDAEISIQLLEPMCMFYSYSSYRLMEESTTNFDAKICQQHLQDCLKSLLCCYDECDRVFMHKIIAVNQKKRQTPPLRYKLINRVYIEALYVLLNLGHVEPLDRATKLPKTLKRFPLDVCAQMSLSMWTRNFRKTLELSTLMPPILHAVFALHLPNIRRNLMISFSHGYNSPQLQVPISFLQRLLMLGDMKEMQKICAYYSVKISPDLNLAHFEKDKFLHSKPPERPKHLKVVHFKMSRANLPDIMFLKFPEMEWSGKQ